MKKLIFWVSVGRSRLSVTLQSDQLSVACDAVMLAWSGFSGSNIYFTPVKFLVDQGVLVNSSQAFRVPFLSAALVLALCGCSPSHDSKPDAVPSSVAPSEVDSTCPGVPISSVGLVLEDLHFSPTSFPEPDSDTVRNVECFGSMGNDDDMKTVFFTRFGKNLTGEDVHDNWRAYDGSLSKDVFPVPGVEGAKGEVLLEKAGGGSSIVTCGDSFILITFFPVPQLNGDLNVNLRNLALSMVPWVCKGEPVPGLGAPLSPAFPTGTAPASTIPEAQGDDPAQTSPESSPEQ